MKRQFILSFMLFLLAVGAAAQSITVRGTVTDNEGEPLPGVAVIDKSKTTNAAVTDLDGKYSIKIFKDGFLEFSCLGYTTVLEAVNSRSVIDITLTPDTYALEDVVVIAYGTAKKSDLTGAVATVDMRSIEDVPATSVESALQGRVAGAEFVSSTGEPGSSASVQIRGSRSISAGNEPLIVVDGVVDAVSSLNEINPSDIKSISVLKDVSSTSLYGSRGANGVILITTESPVASNFSVKFKATGGVSQIAGGLDIMNASEFAEYCNMCLYFDSSLAGKPQTASTYYFDDPSKYGEGTDWVKTMSRTAFYQDYNLSATGRSKVVKIETNFGYNNTQGIIIGSGFQRWTGRVLVEAKPFKWLQAGVRVYYANRSSDFATASITGTSATAAIYLSPLLGIEDTWNSYGSEVAAGGSVFNNPYIEANNITNRKNMANLNLMPYLHLYLGNYTQVLSKFSYVQQDDKRFYYSPSFMPVAKRYLSGGTAVAETYLSRMILSENTVTFKRTFSRNHTVDLLGGFTFETKDADYTYTRGTGYLDDNVTAKNMGSLLDPRNLSINDYETIRTRVSFLARANYDYRKKYYLTLTARADGASNFAPSRKWGFFPAIALRWNVNKNLSLRASAGRSGNDAISPYLSIPTLTSARTGWIFGDYQPISFYNTRLANSNLTWETTDSYNLGLNASFLKERIQLEMDAYHSRTKDLLLAQKINRASGYDVWFNNVGSTVNTGIEASLTTRNIVKKRFGWSTTLTLSHNVQKVQDVGQEGLVGTFYNPRNTTQPLYGYKNGYPVNSIWGYQYAGVWHSQAEIDRNKITHTYVSDSNPSLGGTRYADINNDGILDQNDLVFQGSSDPVLYGGIQNTITWRDLTVKAFFAYSLGGKIYNIWQFWNGSGSRAYNKYRFLLDSWHPVRNPDSDIPRAGYEDFVGSDRMLYDASWFRLKELSVSYRLKLPAKVKWIKSVQLGVSAENLFLLKNYIGFDPDVSTESGARRIDNASYPRPRTFVFNINLTY
ncbi:MAG: TonB-dependent receptor [Bacteroidales bacterium]|nr:TonB-dependent receptor [Bacteroidales bacterium]